MNIETIPNYDFQVTKVLGQAWDKVTGIKGRFWKALIIIALITIATTLIAFGIDFSIMGFPTSVTEGGDASVERVAYPIAQLIQMIFSIFLITPLFSGLLMLCIKHCGGVFVPFTSVFEYLRFWKKLWVYPVAMTIIGLTGNLNIEMLQIVMLILMIFLAVTYIMFIPLIVDQNLGIWAALETSRKAIFKHWFKTLWFVILITFIMIVSAFSFGIAYIWTLPWVYNAFAVLYRTIYNIEELKAK